MNSSLDQLTRSAQDCPTSGSENMKNIRLTGSADIQRKKEKESNLITTENHSITKITEKVRNKEYIKQQKTINNIIGIKSSPINSNLEYKLIKFST